MISEKEAKAIKDSQDVKAGLLKIAFSIHTLSFTIALANLAWMVKTL